ncbi:MAG TPA: LytR C-terminal domain-containing protein, partial [Solirubrobacteraceae bacterium]|nr:LytR C-terminal domain-containing protein [Solirubrobacteraceae bacterium]
PGQDTRESAAARPEPLSPPDDDDGGVPMRRIAIFAGGGVAALLVVAVLMLVLTGGDETQPPNDFGNTPPAQESEGPGAAGAAGSRDAAGGRASSELTVAERRATKVAVLNGTTQTGLARNVGDKIEKERFTLGSIGTNPDQQIPATIIAYTAGHEAAARAVAKIVGVSTASVQPADANTSASADADVVVIVGLDQTG